MSTDDLTPPVMDTAEPSQDKLSQDERDAPHSERRNEGERAHYKRSIYALPVSMQVVIGSARPTISDLLQMKDGTLLTLSSKIDDPVDLCINDRIIARGELVETDPATGAIGVRLTEIVDISEDILNA